MILNVDSKVDYAFKLLFGRDVTRPILIDVIDAVLNPPPGHDTRDVILLNPFNAKDSLDDKLSIVDIKASDRSGRQFNLEMQMFAVRYYENRILYYGTQLYQDQLHEGDDYGKLKPMISISFLDYVLFPQTPAYHLCFRLLEDTHHFPMMEGIEFHVLQLPNFTKSADELTSRLDIWLYFLRHAAMIDTEAIPNALRQPMVLRALEELKMLAQNEQERARYDSRRKAQMDYNSGLIGARDQGRDEARIEIRTEEKISAIRFCERLLSRPETPIEQLSRLPLDELTRLAEGLQEQVLKQHASNTGRL